MQLTTPPHAIQCGSQPKGSWSSWRNACCTIEPGTATTLDWLSFLRALEGDGPDELSLDQIDSILRVISHARYDFGDVEWWMIDAAAQDRDVNLTAAQHASFRAKATEFGIDDPI